MTNRTKKRIYLADLAYFNRYASAMVTIPLNIGYIASYILKRYRAETEVSLFKDPRKLLLASKENPPDVLGLSCYYWNWHLDVLIANRVKTLNPECLVVIGGPQVDTDLTEQRDLYESFKGSLDLMVLNEGELGFSNIIERLLSNSRDKLFNDELDGCTFYDDKDRPVAGKDIGLSLDLESLPSPFLSGLLDEFLSPDFMPIIQTSRMCPYSCSYCCSGKLHGKLRTMPEAVVKAEIEYIAKKYRDHPHRLLYISDENFGINKRDSNIAEFLVRTKEKIGYPRQTYCYFDKKLSPTIKKSALLFGDMNSGGLQLAFQSFNKDSLKAVKRRNMSDEDMVEAVKWAHTHGLKTSSELIFGLPFETKQSFLDSLEFIMQTRIDTIAAHNLFLLKGIELNREGERKKFALATKFRPSFASAYDSIDNEFVCESEEVVISSSHFSFDDFLDIRKISLMFYVINMLEYFKKVFIFLIDHDQKVIPIFDSIMNPSAGYMEDIGYINYVSDFVEAATSELFNSHEEVSSHLKGKFTKNDNRVFAPTRLNVYYTSRLIYKENWFSGVISRLLKEVELDDQASIILRDLMAISENEWIDIGNPQSSRSLLVSADTLSYLNLTIPKPGQQKYIYKMSLSDQQRKIIESYNNQYMTDDDSYISNILDFIHPRKLLRYACIEVESVPNHE